MTSRSADGAFAEAPHGASDPAPKRTPRAGRDLPKAIGVGLGLIAVAVTSLLVWRPGFVGLVAIVMAAAVWEMRGTFQRARGISVVWIPVMVGVVATVVATWWWGHEAQAVGVALTALAVMFYRLRGGGHGYLVDIAASIFLVVYLGGIGSFATLLVQPADGVGRILVFLIAVVCSDTGGYAVGVMIGKHPMAPTISPKKSWEGFAGSLLLATIGAAVAMPLLLHAHWWQGAILGAVVALVAVGGDLAESLIKRDIGVKDMGTLVPGHGGVMDRLDSLLPCAVVSWVLLAVFIPV
ncbi:MAG: phosphatidate cytidylyltransferase [Nakamurella sp.]